MLSGPCADGDFYAYGLPADANSKAAYSTSASHGQQAILATFNSRRSALSASDSREAIGSWLRGLIQGSDDASLRPVEGHFLEGEPGFRKGARWQTTDKPPSIQKLTILLGTQWPPEAPVRRRLEAGARSAGVTIVWKDWKGTPDEDFDLKIAGARIQKGRALWGQYQWRSVKNVAAQAVHFLDGMTARHASTGGSLGRSCRLWMGDRLLYA